jgi:hypothetical protein
MCVTCGGALFHHGMGGAVEKGVVGLAGLLTSAVFLFYFIVKHRLYDYASAVSFLYFHLSATFSNDNQCLLIFILAPMHH